MTDVTCSVVDCERKPQSRGLCSTHYGYGLKTGEVPRLNHRLTDLDPDARSANCSSCGVTRIVVVKGGTFRCIVGFQSSRAKRVAIATGHYVEPPPAVVTAIGTQGMEPVRQASRVNKLKSKYGITLDDYDAMVAHQRGRCAICETVPANGLVIDHNHDTGEVRGLLCGSCNTGIGHLGDDPSRLVTASIYLLAKSHEGSAKSYARRMGYLMGIPSTT